MLTARQRAEAEALATRRAECPARDPVTQALCGLETWAPESVSAVEWTCECGATCRLEAGGSLAAWHETPVTEPAEVADPDDLRNL
jgi:hypothetical protein